METFARRFYKLYDRLFDNGSASQFWPLLLEALAKCRPFSMAPSHALAAYELLVSYSIFISE